MQAKINSGEVKDVIVIGHNKEDNTWSFFGSDMSNEQFNYLLDKAKFTFWGFEE